ncbi:MAG: hypothetical protein C4541_04805 [Candidatus Auribacter fodinae]|jgi:predicted ferric reductase|uniref:FAD-binding FR-type domain-containing protein n=1 Tax=Candidatus Auribacter fodinae TaxID=2093366 RepID=A0A3A4REU7_9BACT|nr:MAG: hypothetical protein C4541_04805 [Candidatus Auribacter fodinae]
MKSVFLKKFLLYCVLFLNPLVILWLWYTNEQLRFEDYNTNIFMEAGRIAGLLAVYCALFQLILIGRVKWIESVFGLDRLTRIHKWNGYSLALLLVAHPVFLSIGYGQRDFISFSEQFTEFLSWEGVAAAAGALALFVAVIMLSITVVKRKMNYEIWYYIHLTTYCAILLAFEHQLETGSDFTSNTLFKNYWYALYGFVFLNLIFFRFSRPLYHSARHRFKVDKVVRETNDVVSVYITGRNIDRFCFEPGQFVIVRFMSKKCWIQAHPFSLSCEPNGNFVRLTIKRAGDFTAQVSSINPGTSVIIDGPHGIFTLRRVIKEKTLLIAGGIGITPLRAMIPQLINRKKDTILLYANRQHKDAALTEELASFTKNGHFKTHFIMSSDTSWTGEKGHIDRDKILRLAPDAAERDVYLCGPPGMMTATRKALLQIGLKPAQIHYENFSF